MPNNLKEKFRKQKNIRYREETGVYEIRKRINGVNYFASSKNRDEAVRKFIEQLQAGPKTNASTTAEAERKLTLEDIVTEWLEYKRGQISLDTCNDYKSLADRLILPELGKRNITEIRTIDLDRLMHKFDDAPRMYEEVRSVLNQTLKYAIASGIITNNPLGLIPFKRAERESRERLTDEQVRTFFRNIKEPQFGRIRQPAYIMFFFGLRPCEFDKEARFENGFLICRNRKRKGGKIEYKKIPIPKQARGYISFDEPITFSMSYPKSLDLFKKIFNDNSVTFYNLRHTFASMCAERVREEIVEVWMGDSPERLVGKTYVHYKDDFMIKQMNKVKFITE